MTRRATMTVNATMTSSRPSVSLFELQTWGLTNFFANSLPTFCELFATFCQLFTLFKLFHTFTNFSILGSWCGVAQIFAAARQLGFPIGFSGNLQSANSWYLYLLLFVQIVCVHSILKYIGVLRDTACAPKPTTQYNTIQYHAIPFIR